MAQLVKNLPAMRATWVQSLGWEDPLEKGKATNSINSGLENSMDCIKSMGSQRVKLNLVTKQGFPHSSVRKESTCNAGDPGSVPGSGRFLGEGKGNSHFSMCVKG